MDIACQLTHYGFGRSLLQAAIMLQFVEFMEFVAKWCDDICEVLITDPQHFLGWQYHELAHVIKEECIKYPDPAILAMYLLPLMSWSDGSCPPVTTITSHQPDLASLAAFCSQCLCWSPDTVQSRLMDAWAGTAIQALLQLLGNIDGEGLQHGLWVVGYCDKLPPTYKISMSSWPLATLVDCGDGFYEMEVPAVMLECSRLGLVDEEAGGQ
ncbi:hypothetical protein EDC04DRAFT_2912203 [Pisolithus marmoratus]|nr:hypothetical protein EDC04DRAFT_2912203 [Pisolithus marmoratus]